MTQAERAHIRALIDAVQRQRIEREEAGQQRCAGCGVRHERYLIGCATCVNRRWKRQSRGQHVGPLEGNDPVPWHAAPGRPRRRLGMRFAAILR